MARRRRELARRRRARFVGLAAVAVGVFVLFVFVLPGLLANGTFTDDAERLKAENDVRATLLQGLAGAFLLLGLYFTASTLQLNRQGQITERFTRAIDQLGNLTTPQVRLGGSVTKHSNLIARISGYERCFRGSRRAPGADAPGVERQPPEPRATAE